MDASYISSNSFRVVDDQSVDFITGRRVRLDCGDDGIIIASVVSSVFDTGYTNVVIDEANITVNLVEVLYSVVKPGQYGNIPNHSHSSSEGEGGELDIPMELVGLIDTPITYSGTEGDYLQSTGSGTIFSNISKVVDSEKDPVLTTEHPIGTYYISKETNSIFKKERLATVSGIPTTFLSINVKSVILDCTNNYGDGFMGLRQCDFYYQGTKLNITEDDFSAYATTAYSNCDAKYAFDTSTSYLNTYVTNTWMSTSGNATNQRLIVVFNTVQAFDQVIINNNHGANPSGGGTNTDRGVKDLLIYTSTDDITDTVYGNVITSSELIFNGAINEHTAVNEQDDQVLSLIFNSGMIEDVGWDKLFRGPTNLIGLNDTPSTYSGTEGQYLQSTGSGIAFSTISEAVTASWLFSNVPPIDKIQATPGTFYCDTSIGNIYEKNNTVTTISGVLVDGFNGTSLNSSIWDTRLVGGASVTVDDVLQLNNESGVHGGAHVFSKESFAAVGTSILTFKWKPHTNHYSTAAPPYVVIRNENTFTVNTAYGNTVTNCINIALGDSSDSTERTKLLLRVDTTLVASVNIDIDHSIWHDVVFSINWETYFIEIDVDDSTYTMSHTATASEIAAIGDSFVVEFSTCDYNKTNTESFDDILLKYATDDAVLFTWDFITSFPKKFISLDDTPSTYSGTEGMVAKSTGSGIIFDESTSVRSSSIEPDFDTIGFLNDFHIKELSGKIYKKKRPIVFGACVAKSVVFDLLDNFGGSYLSITKIEFLDVDLNVIPLTDNFTSYVTSTWSASSDAPFLTSTSKTGESYNVLWMSADNSPTRLVCVFDNVTDIYGIIINNGYANYSNSISVNNIKIYSSFDTINTTVHGESILNSTLLYDGQLAQHPAVDIVDDQNLMLENLNNNHGWDIVLETKNNLIDLNDTPTTYSGTEGMVAKSTGSGIAFVGASRLTSDTILPSLVTPGYIGDYYLVESAGAFYKKFRESNSEGFIAKSVILDFADTWGTSYIGMRSIEFFKLGSLVAVTGSNVTAYSTLGSQEPAIMAFDTTLSKTGAGEFGWFCTTAATNQRIIGVFDTPISFDQVVVNNYHHNGGYRDRGVKTTKIHITTDEVTSTVYDEAIANSTLIFDGSIDIHSVGDVVSDQELTLPEFEIDTGWDIVLETKDNLIGLNDTPTTYSGTEGKYLQSTGSGINFYPPPAILLSSENAPTGLEDSNIGDFNVSSFHETVYIKNRAFSDNNVLAKSVVFDIADDWGNTSYMAVRSIEFLFNGEVIPNIATTNFVAYATSTVTVDYLPEFAFDTSLLKTGAQASSQWQAASPDYINVRLICVFNSETLFDSIIINNAHSVGSATDRGIKNIKITTSTDEITNTSYNAEVSNSVVIFEGVVNEHVPENIEDPQELLITGAVADSGWDSILKVSKNFTDLEDTPTTYSGGQYLITTDSGVEFTTLPPRVYVYENSPKGNDFATIGDFGIISSEDTLYVKNRTTERDINAKSVIFDIKDNYGDPSFMSIRSIDFLYQGSLITNLASTDFVAYATTSHSSYYLPAFSFDTSKSKIGSLVSNQWMSLSSNVTNQRLICVFNSETLFDAIIINNAHSVGLQTSRGSKNIKITSSTDEITDTTYNASVSNSKILFDGVLNEHIESDVEDPQDLFLEGAVSDSGWDLILETNNNFTDLGDTPTTFSGGQYLRTTASGIDAIDGIILKAPNESEWLIKVTNSGTLYTEAL